MCVFKVVQYSIQANSHAAEYIENIKIHDCAVYHNVLSIERLF